VGVFFFERDVRRPVEENQIRYCEKKEKNTRVSVVVKEKCAALCEEKNCCCENNRKKYQRKYTIGCGFQRDVRCLLWKTKRVVVKTKKE